MSRLANARPGARRLRGLTTGRLLLAVGLTVMAVLAGGQAVAQKPAGSVGAIGRIQPRGGIMTVGTSPGQVLVDSVLVKEGDTVRKGQALAVLAERHLRETEVQLATERLRTIEETSRSRLDLATVELDAARVSRDTARADLQAVEGLDPQTVSAREKRLRAQQLSTAEVALRVAQARVEDLRRSQEPELRQARAQLETARAVLSRTQVVAPMAGVVVEVMARPGGVLAGPVLTLADTSTMQVVADVFEGDLGRIAPGSKARVSNAALGGQVTGTVARIGRTVDAGSRLGKVTIQLDQASPADRYLGMQVEVSIDAAAK